jgi:hypothetical protein
MATHGKVHKPSDLHPFATARVIQQVMASPNLCVDMLCALRQDYADVIIFKVDETVKSGDAVMLGSGAEADAIRARYAAFFHDVQACSTRLIPGITTCHEAGSVKLLGYVPYLKSGTSNRELVYAFYHKIERAVSLVVATQASHERKAKQVIANLGKLHSLASVCSFCAAASQELRSCPCGGVQYCDAKCQKQHWKLHKPQCLA